MQLKLPNLIYPILDVAQRLGRSALLRQYPLHRNENYEPFFIVGSGRSGTTLLRRILQASPEVHIPPETFVLADVIEHFRRGANRPWRDVVYMTLALFEYYPEFEKFGIQLRRLANQLLECPREKRSLAFILDKIYRYHGEQMGETFRKWGDKTPINAFCLEQILGVFPDAKFIHMLRDGADVVHSYVKAGLQPSIEAAAKRWQRSVRAVEGFARRHPAICHEVRYEQLVTDPERVVRSVCRFLGIAFDPRMINRLDHIDSMPDVKQYRHLVNVLHPIAPDSIGKGRKALTVEEKGRLQRLIGEDLERLGYRPLV